MSNLKQKIQDRWQKFSQLEKILIGIILILIIGIIVRFPYIKGEVSKSMKGYFKTEKTE